jgi:hypothetical protein
MRSNKRNGKQGNPIFEAVGKVTPLGMFDEFDLVFLTYVLNRFKVVGAFNATSETWADRQKADQLEGRIRRHLEHE